MRAPATTRIGRIADALAWIVGVAAATAVVLLFTLGGGDHPDITAVADRGAQLYAQHCAVCHGDRGRGATGPALVGAASVEDPDPAVTFAIVATGRAAMPAFAGRLDPSELDAVVDFVRTGLG